MLAQGRSYIQSAWWLVTFCVLGALGCAALAIVGGRSVRSILFSLVAAPFAALRGIPDKQRPDVEQELRSSIADAVEDRVGAGEERAAADPPLRPRPAPEPATPPAR